MTVATYNVAANTDEMFAGPRGFAFKNKLISDVGELMKVLAF